MEPIGTEQWKNDLPAFVEKTRAFYAGEVDKNAYKGFSGYYGSYAQKGGAASMLRLRMPAGRVTREKLAFVADAVRRHGVKRLHFTTCQSIQLHDLTCGQTCAIMAEALDAGIVTMGGGGDYPRNVMCSPLSGLEEGECFDVLPWAEAAGQYLLTFIKAEKMPRKLKVGFSSSPNNLTHATYRDLGFAARPDGLFDVYSAGGLGNNPRFGVKVAEGVEPAQIGYYIKAMWLTFRAYGNYENRGRARTRYMQDACGGPEGYRAAYLEKLAEVLASGEDLTLTPTVIPHTKTSAKALLTHPQILPQKQAGLAAVAWHPLGGQPDVQTFCAVADAVQTMPEAELRLAPDETAYIVNLDGDEAWRILRLVEADNAGSLFETSVSCIGAATCQVGVRDSQALLAACTAAVRAANLPDGALPQIHISGCPSSCGTHQTGAIGFRGAAKVIDRKPHSAFTLYVNGRSRQGEEAMGRELGVVLEERIPAFLVALGRTVAAAGVDYAAWAAADPTAIDAVAAPYLA